jgi:hypothetical protein
MARMFRLGDRKLENEGLHFGRQWGMHNVDTALAERVAELFKGVISTAQHWSLYSCEKNADIFVEFQ